MVAAGGIPFMWHPSSCNNYKTRLGLYFTQYFYSLRIREDNTPVYSEYLGYLTTSDLYPDFKPIGFRVYFQEVLDGNARRLYSKYWKVFRGTSRRPYDTAVTCGGLRPQVSVYLSILLRKLPSFFFVLYNITNAMRNIFSIGVDEIKPISPTFTKADIAAVVSLNSLHTLIH